MEILASWVVSTVFHHDSFQIFPIFKFCPFIRWREFRIVFAGLCSSSIVIHVRRNETRLKLFTKSSLHKRRVKVYKSHMVNTVMHIWFDIAHWYCDFAKLIIMISYITQTFPSLLNVPTMGGFQILKVYLSSSSRELYYSSIMQNRMFICFSLYTKISGIQGNVDQSWRGK